MPGTTALTFKGQVAKESSQKVHGVHDEDGDVGHLLHPLLRWTEIRELCECHILHRHVIKYCRWQRGDSLAELGVDGEDLGVANKGESQDGNGVCSLWRTHKSMTFYD